MRTRTLSLKKGDKSCEQTKTIQKKCKKGECRSRRDFDTFTVSNGARFFFFFFFFLSSSLCLIANRFVGDDRSMPIRERHVERMRESDDDENR